jgi:hypothetical protein
MAHNGTNGKGKEEEEKECFIVLDPVFQSK